MQFVARKSDATCISIDRGTCLAHAWMLPTDDAYNPKCQLRNEELPSATERSTVPNQLDS